MLSFWVYVFHSKGPKGRQFAHFSKLWMCQWNWHFLGVWLSCKVTVGGTQCLSRVAGKYAMGESLASYTQRDSWAIHGCDVIIRNSTAIREFQPHLKFLVNRVCFDNLWASSVELGRFLDNVNKTEKKKETAVEPPLPPSIVNESAATTDAGLSQLPLSNNGRIASVNGLSSSIV